MIRRLLYENFRAFTDDLAYWHIIAEVEKDEPILKNSDDYNIWFTE